MLPLEEPFVWKNSELLWQMCTESVIKGASQVNYDITEYPFFEVQFVGPKTAAQIPALKSAD